MPPTLGGPAWHEDCVGTAHPTPLSGMDSRVQAGWQPLSAAKWMGLCRGAGSTIHFTLRVQWLPPDASRTTTDRMNSTRGFGQATENHRDHRADMGRIPSVPSVPSVANPVAGEAQPTSRADVWPSWSPDGWRLFDSQCESKSRAWWFGPALCLRQKAATRRFPGPYHRHPDRRAEGPEWRDPFEQCFHKAPDAEPQHAHPWG